MAPTSRPTRTTSRTFLSALAATGITIALAACGGDSDESQADDTSAADAPAGAEITIADFAFSDTDTISPGSTMTVTNTDGVEHTWTSEDGLFDSGVLAPGSSFEFRFDESGEFNFVCEIHPSMSGAVTVKG